MLSINWFAHITQLMKLPVPTLMNNIIFSNRIALIECEFRYNILAMEDPDFMDSVRLISHKGKM